MPIYFFWGEDDFSLTQAVKQLQQSFVDPNWLQFNYDKLSGEQADANIEALNLAMTPVFGMGGRLVWLADANICQSCPEELLKELKRTLPNIPENSHLLFTSSKKPDQRLKSSKLLDQYGEFREFSLIPPWKTDQLIAKVEQIAREVGVKLTATATELLAESVGNHTRQLWSELEKLKLYSQTTTKPLDVDTVLNLVNFTTQNSLQLAAAIRNGKVDQALGLVTGLVNLNEPALKIVATLVGLFRTWGMVKLFIEAGENDDKAIAAAADVTNPKRIYFLRQEVRGFSSQQFLSTLPLLLELEFSLKKGAPPLSTLQTKVIELCKLFD